MSSVNKKFLAVVMESQGGGSFLVLPLDKVRVVTKVSVNAPELNSLLDTERLKNKRRLLFARRSRVSEQVHCLNDRCMGARHPSRCTAGLVPLKTSRGERKSRGDEGEEHLRFMWSVGWLEWDSTGIPIRRWSLFPRWLEKFLFCL